MTTTFEKWNGKQRGNYCTLPTIDVDIVDPSPVCDKCNGALIWNPTRSYGMGAYQHVKESDCSYAQVRPTCRYCGTNEKGIVEHKQHPWYDATECSRCGGVSGYAIGE